jgi:phosphate transport system permease protein
MTSSVLLIVLAGLTVAGFYLGRSRALASVGGKIRDLHSLPGYYGYAVALWCGLPSFIVYVLWSIIGAKTGHGTPGYLGFAVILAVAVAGLAYSHRQIRPDMKARDNVERVVRIFLIICSAIAILTTIGIILSLIFESIRFFEKVSPIEFLFGLEWSPQTALRADQVGATGRFGAVPLFAGTMMISLIAMLVAGPVGLLSAIYMSEYAGPKLRATAKPILEVLAGIPTVVYGFFAALTMAPLFRGWGDQVGFDISSESAIAAGLVMGIMIIPFVSSLSDDVISAVPQSLREGSFGLGATQSETIRRVILPAALPGIVGSLLLATSRAIGDRGHGRGPGRQHDCQPIRGGHHGDRADRHPAGRRPGVRQRQDPGGLRARSGAVLRHPLPQHHRLERCE